MDPARQAGLPAVGAFCELVPEDGAVESARDRELAGFTTKRELALASIADLGTYRRGLHEPQVRRSTVTRYPPNTGRGGSSATRARTPRTRTCARSREKRPADMTSRRPLSKADDWSGSDGCGCTPAARCRLRRRWPLPLAECDTGRRPLLCVAPRNPTSVVALGSSYSPMPFTHELFGQENVSCPDRKRCAPARVPPAGSTGPGAHVQA